MSEWHRVIAGGQKKRGVAGDEVPSAGGGGGIEVRNFSQFSAISQFFAIFRNFSQFSAIFRNFSAIFHTSRFSDCLPMLVQNNENFFFLLLHTLSNVAKSPEPGIAQLVVALHCNSRVLGSNQLGTLWLPSLFWSFYLRFFGLFHACMFACLHVHAARRTVCYGSPHQGGPFQSVTGTCTP